MSKSHWEQCRELAQNFDSTISLVYAHDHLDAVLMLGYLPEGQVEAVNRIAAELRKLAGMLDNINYPREVGAIELPDGTHGARLAGSAGEYIKDSLHDYDPGPDPRPREEAQP